MVEHPPHHPLASLCTAKPDARSDGAGPAPKTGRGGAYQDFTRPAGTGTLIHSPFRLKGTFFLPYLASSAVSSERLPCHTLHRGYSGFISTTHQKGDSSWMFIAPLVANRGMYITCGTTPSLKPALATPRQRHGRSCHRNSNCSPATARIS